MALAADYAHEGVLTATQRSAYGFHHGPIPNHNHGWIPPSHQLALQNGQTSLPPVTAAENSTAPAQGVQLSTVNGRICWIDMGDSTMCGQTFATQPALRRHTRTVHPGAVTNPTRTNTSGQELVSGMNSLKHYVLTSGWRLAQFAHEPGRGPPDGPISEYATHMEEIARGDVDFRRSYGSFFHRSRSTITPSSSAKKRKRAPDPASSDSDDPIRGSPTVRAGRGRGRGKGPATRGNRTPRRPTRTATTTTTSGEV